MYQTLQKMQALPGRGTVWKTLPRVTGIICALTFLPTTIAFAVQINLAPLSLPTAPQQQQQAPILPKAQDATVHIICNAMTPKGMRAVSGTGAVIDPRGIILTSAHIIAQLASPTAKAHCVARFGNPSANPTPISVLYISPEWIKEYAPKIFQDELVGTGENDFALALIAPSQKNQPRPFISLSHVVSFEPGSQVLACGYPAEFISPDTITTRLYQNCSYITTGKGFTFGKDTFDAISLGNSILARAGVSGGPIMDRFGSLVGIMATASREKSTNERTLTAVTREHIERSFKKSSQQDLTTYVALPLETLTSNARAHLQSLSQYFEQPQTPTTPSPSSTSPRAN